MPLHNDTDELRRIYHGDRIAQLVFLPYIQVDFEQVNKLEPTDRGESGFNSTGTR